jgi:hypothetical protein
MNVVNKYTTVIAKFERLVHLHFAFLEDEYGFTVNPTRSLHLNEPRDASVSIRYNGNTVSVQIGMSVIGAGMGVIFRNEKWLETPKHDRVKSVSLESVLRVRSVGKAKTLAQVLLTDSRAKYWPEGFLVEKMELAIEKLAEMVRQYALDILEGNIACFKEIAAAESETHGGIAKLRRATGPQK